MTPTQAQIEDCIAEWANDEEISFDATTRLSNKLAALTAAETEEEEIEESLKASLGDIAAAEVVEQAHLVSEIHRQHKEIERLRTEIQWLRAALQRIVDNGEQSGFAYGVAFAAIRALKDKP